MIIVIIAGGSGTRLWPLSQGNHPKHLLKLTGQYSLLQNTFRRAALMTDEIYIIPEASHIDEVREQLPELPADHILVEPGRRGTASCVTWALAHLSLRHEASQPVVFLHADHHIIDTENFCRTVRAAANASVQTGAVALIGLEPTYPATGFGYIQMGAEHGIEEGLPVREVKSFLEKPDLKTAEDYLASGEYLWNLGLFAAPLGVWERQLREYAPDLFTAYEGLRALDGQKTKLPEYYLSLKSQPIDTALIEKSERLVVLPGKFDWADIGSFFDLHKILKGDDGNSLAGDVSMIDCEDSMIHASSKPIIAIGLSGLIVVDTPDGLLVCTKEQSQLVGELSKRLAARKTEDK